MGTKKSDRTFKVGPLFAFKPARGYSHSIVAGGLPVMS